MLLAPNKLWYCYKFVFFLPQSTGHIYDVPTSPHLCCGAHLLGADQLCDKNVPIEKTISNHDEVCWYYNGDDEMTYTTFNKEQTVSHSHFLSAYNHHRTNIRENKEFMPFRALQIKCNVVNYQREYIADLI